MYIFNVRNKDVVVVVVSRDRSFYVEDQDPNAPRGCVFCNNTSHKPRDCTVISSAADRKKFLQEKRLF